MNILIPSSSSSSRIKVHYSKPKMIDLSLFTATPTESDASGYSPFAIEHIQFYNPIYRKFFEMNAKNYDRIALNHPYHIQDIEHCLNIDQTAVSEKSIFVKFSPLLDPFRYMTGKYNVQDECIRKLPRLDSDETTVHSKMLSPHNASYVDCFFNYLSSSLMHQHGFIHGVDFYGSFLGIQKQFRVCVTDDLDYLRGSNFFQENVGKLFYVENPLGEEEAANLEQIAGSRRNKKRLQILSTNPGDGESVTDIDLDLDLDLDLDPNLDQERASSCEVVYVKAPSSSLIDSASASSPSSSSSSLSSHSNNSETNYTSSSDSISDKNSADWEDEESSDDDDNSTSSSTDQEEEEIYGYIHNFPIQMICLEKCDGTLDELFVQGIIDDKNGASALFQIVMILLTYQKAFQFTHNDLHTNNIMYVNTEIEYLTYRFAGKVYRVPTYGRIFKLIDFGRSIYRFQEHAFCSDSFGPGGDAATQYNIEPFMNRNKPRLEPNYSFDLCRLGSSIFDFLMDIDHDVEEMDDLQRTIYRWCLDDFGKNVLYKKNGDERYPNFKLYKMIARTVHRHTPESQLEDAFFQQFLLEDSANVQVGMDLDILPSYVTPLL